MSGIPELRGFKTLPATNCIGCAFYANEGVATDLQIALCGAVDCTGHTRYDKQSVIFVIVQEAHDAV